MIVEGLNVINELLNSHYEVEKVFVADFLKDSEKQNITNLANERNVTVEIVDKATLQKLSPSSQNQGYIAFVKAFEYNDLHKIIQEAEQNNDKMFFVILDSVEDPHNLGAIIRTCECAGVTAIILPKNRACPVNATVFKTSAGALVHTNICQVTNLNQTIEMLKKHNVWVYGLEAGNKQIYDTDLQGNIALVIGSEGFGISRLVAQNCDEILSIQMKGKVNSLNASNAAAIAIFEALRQRKQV